MLNLPLDRLLGALGETLMMTAVSGAISFAVGLPLGLILVGAAPGGLWENRWVNRIVGAIVNGFRSLPFIILLVAVIPLTRLIVGTSIGTAAAIVPLSISGIPYFGRVSEAALREVDRGGESDGRGELDHHSRGAHSGGAAKPDCGFHRHAGALGRSVRHAGAVGAGGLGDLAIRYGYQRFETSVMIAVIVVLIALVALIQAGGDRLARWVDHR
jgi:D-methionine transport system permease protein